MKNIMRKILQRAFAGAAAAFLMLACARYGGGPTGGPVDVAPPVLLSALPPEGDTSVGIYGPTEILLNFDEYVVVENMDKIVTSPPLSKVSYMGHLQQVRVTIEDTLLEDKTYSINFGDAIGDLHESTPLQGYTYYFSTGHRVDSGQMSGLVKDAFTLEPVGSASVMFYSHGLEGYPFFGNPDYVAVTDTGGFFQCRYMAEGCYHVVVASEESRDYRIDPSSEKMAYSSECWPTQAYRPQVLFRKQAGVKESDTMMRRANDSLIRMERNWSIEAAIGGKRVLYAYQDRLDSLFLKEAKFEKNGEISLTWYYAVDLDSLHFEFLPSFAAIESVRQWEALQADTMQQQETGGRRNRKERKADEMDLPDLTWPSRLRYSVVPQQDPLALKIYFNDYSVSELRLAMRYGAYVDTAELMLPGSPKATADTARFRVSLSPGELFFKDSLLLDFSFPVVGTDWGKASLIEIRSDEEGEKDSLLIGIGETVLEKVSAVRYCLKYPWKPGCSYSVFIPSACFTDYFGRLVDTAVFNASVPALDAYGQVGLKVRGADSGSLYVIQMVQPGDRKVLASRFLPADGNVEYPYVKPGNISFVLFRDDNRNGRWDEGCCMEGLQPERRWFFPKTLQVEADWRIEETWQIPAY